MNKPPEFAIYVSSVPGKTFIRPGSSQILGGRRIGGGPIEWQPEKIVPIPLAEYGRFSREYERAIVREKSLRKRSAEEWQAQEAAQAKAAQAAREAGEQAMAEARARQEAAEISPDAPASDTP